MKPRAGVTLVEVLVAIFVMGIGLLSLLTLFPLGASNMAQAIRDSRAAAAARNAGAIAESFIDADVAPNTFAIGVSNKTNLTIAPSVFTNPLPGTLPNLGANNYDGPSYAVYVDPFGFYSSFDPYQKWVAGRTRADGAIPRRSLRIIDNPPAGVSSISLIKQYFTLQDDLVFGKNGLADLSSGTVERESSYSWAYLVRRPRRPNTNVVDLSIIVYNQRPLRLSQGLNPNEFAYPSGATTANSFAKFDNTQNTITLAWDPNNGEATPPIRAGGWILDATILNGVPHGYFYRVTDVNEIAGANQVELTCATAFKDFPANTQTNGVAIILEGVAEVIDKGSGWLP